jgi:hypothetical protein
MIKVFASLKIHNSKLKEKDDKNIIGNIIMFNVESLGLCGQRLNFSLCFSGFLSHLWQPLAF